MTDRWPRGFSVLSPEDLKRVSSKGGKAAHAKGGAWHWTSDEAREAGRKGGLATKAKRKAELLRQVEAARIKTNELWERTPVRETPGASGRPTRSNGSVRAFRDRCALPRRH